MKLQTVQTTTFNFCGCNKFGNKISRKLVSTVKEAPKGMTKTVKDAVKEDPELTELLIKASIATALMQTSVGGACYATGYIQGLNASS